MEPTSLHALVGNLIGQCQRQFGRRLVARLGCEPVEVMADPELLGLAINQLLDNACRYSPPESAVIVELDVQDGFAAVRVTNEGSSIRPAEREQIFERFYRGTETERVTPGAGLGLYVARKILRAHGGVLELDRNRDSPAATTFRIGLPVYEYERQHEQPR
jgi:signal transduction histidine kinase